MFTIPFPVMPVRLAGLIGAGVVILSGGAMAQTPIGSATVVQNDVRGHVGGEIFRINRGDRVILDQLVQTTTNSQAKIVFLDTTNMSVGPDSIVKLDQFVYNGNGTAQTVSINASKGAFRFFSGSSEHRAYKVTTPQAVIGVRGTTYDVFIGGGQTYIKLQDGAVTACVRTGSLCRDVDRPGDYLVVTDTDIQGPFPSNGQTWDFGSLCNGNARDLCNKTQFAMNVPPPRPPGGGFVPPPPPRIRTASLPPVYVPQQPPVYIPPYRPPVRPPVATIPPYVPPYIPPQIPPYIPPPKPVDPCKYGYGRGCGSPTTPPPKDSGCKPGYGRGATGCGTTPPPTNTGCNSGSRQAGCGTGPTRPPYPPFPSKPPHDGKPWPGKPLPQQAGKPYPGTGHPHPGKPWPQQQGQSTPNQGKPNAGNPFPGRPFPGRPLPKQDSRPNPGPARPPVTAGNGRPNQGPIVRFSQHGNGAASRWGAPNRFNYVPRMSQNSRAGMGSQIRQAPRMTVQPRNMGSAPRMSNHRVASTRPVTGRR
jgi:hypothetical protein